MNVLEIKNVKKSFNNSQLHVLKDISLTVAQGEVVAIIGPSGSGKSTLLRCATLLTQMDSGDLLYSGDYAARNNDQGVSVYADKQQLKKIRGRFGLVFQNFNLFPHFSVLKNLTDAPIHVLGRSKEEAEKKAMSLLEKMGLADKADAYPCQLSGGQQQRVAIARALVKMPRVLLLDEPLSNLDARLRLQTREEIRRIQKETGITTVFVTHDQEEAMSISDMIVVMKLGVVQQIGKPQEVYDDPANLFVAKFLGTPPINVFKGRVEGGWLYLDNERVLSVGAVPDQDVMVGIRPEGFIIDPNGPMHCKISSVEVMGRDVSVVSTHPALVSPSIRSIVDADNKIDPAQQTIAYRIKPHKLFIFDSENEERIPFEVK